jgi:hypothetical protein
MRSFAAPLLVLTSLPLAGCGDLFVLRVEEPSLCITLEERTFPGGDIPLQTTELDYDLSPALPEEASESYVEMEVELTSFEIRPRGDTEDLDFLQSAELRMAEIPVATWREGEAPAAIFTVRKGHDLGGAVEKAELRFVLEVSGTLPEAGWTADALACFHVVSRIHYLD